MQGGGEAQAARRGMDEGATRAGGNASSSLLSTTTELDSSEDAAQCCDADRLPDDLLLLVFARLAAETAASVGAGGASSSAEVGASSSSSAPSSSSSSFVWLRTTLPLVSRRWCGLLAGPSPAWRHVVIDVGAEVAAAAAAARRSLMPSSGSARRLWPPSVAVVQGSSSSRGASPTPAPPADDLQQSWQYNNSSAMTAPLAIPSSSRPTAAAGANEAAALLATQHPPLPPASPPTGPVAFSVAPGPIGASPPPHARPLARLSRSSRPPFARTASGGGGGAGGGIAAAAAAGASSSTTAPPRATHHSQASHHPQHYCVRADAVLRWLQPRAGAVQSAALRFPPTAAHDFDSRRWQALIHLLRRPLKELAVAGGGSARPPAAAAAEVGAGGGSPRARPQAALQTGLVASSPPASAAPFSSSGFHYFPASPPPVGAAAAAAGVPQTLIGGGPAATTAATAAAERWRAAAAAATAAFAALGTNPSASAEGEAHSGLFDALGSLRGLESLELAAAPQGPLTGAALPALAFLPRLSRLALSLDLCPAAPAPAPELPPGLTSLKLGNMWLEALFVDVPPAAAVPPRGQPPRFGAGRAGGLRARVGAAAAATAAATTTAASSSSSSAAPTRDPPGPWHLLRELTLVRCTVDADPLPRVCALPRLERLRVVGPGGRGGHAPAHALAPLLPPPPRLAPSSTLVELELADVGLSALGADVAGLVALRRLSLRGNAELGGSGDAAGCLPLELASLPALESLDLSHCGLGQLPRVVPLLSALTELVLRGNQLSSLRGGGASAGLQQPPQPPWSPPAFAGTLRSLDLSDNPRLREIPPLVLACARLERLCVSSSALAAGAPPLRALPRLLPRLCLLRVDGDAYERRAVGQLLNLQRAMLMESRESEDEEQRPRLVVEMV